MKKQFEEIVAQFEEKFAGKDELLKVVANVKSAVLNNIDMYAQPTLSETLSAIWYGEYATSHSGKSMFKDCFGAIQKVANGATFKA